MVGRVLLAVCAVAVLALAGPPGVASAAAPGLVAAYGFEESSGTSALDASGQGNAGSLVNGTARTTQGRFGSALSFDGTNDSVMVSDASSLNLSTGMTLEAWVNPVATDGWRTVVLKERNSDLSYALYGSGEGVPAGSITRTGVGGYTEAFGPAPLVAGSWTHLAATYDGANVRLYADGQQIATRAGAGTLGSGAGNLRIGGNSVWGEWFRGVIDEVRVYNRALPQSEIQADMAASVGGGDPTPPPPGPEQVGSWTPPADWPLVAVHGAMLSNGKVALWDGFGAAMRSERIWDPATGAFEPVPSNKNFFCAGHVLLPDGRLFVAGGHINAYEGIRDTGLLNPLTNSWTAGPMMAKARWYPTTTTLPDGKVLIVAGDSIRRGGPYGPWYAPSAPTLPEIYDPATNTIRSLPSASREMPLYPFTFVTPDGRVVDAGPDKTTRILDVDTGQWSTLPGQSPIDGHSAVMYRPGKILKTGTWSDPDFVDYTIDNRAAALDMTQAVPQWRETAPMKWARTFHTLTVLPDGDVLALGGQRGSNGNDVASTAVLEPEIWSPATDKWTPVARSVRPRGYHNTSLLLPDGRILLAGSGRLDGSMMRDETTAEIFSPPYLHKGPRPTITLAPNNLSYGQQFTVETPDAARIQKVSLVRTGAVTHGLNMDQRFQELSFTRQNGRLTIEGPPNANLAPPGVYYVFLVDDKGVPSKAAMLPLAPGGGQAPDTSAPSVPGGVAATDGQGRVSLRWDASTDNVGVTRYTVHRSTTAGFTPSDANRVGTVTSGTTFVDSPLAVGTYRYRVVAEDAAGNRSAGSAEAAGSSLPDSTAPSVSVSSPAGGATVSGSVSVGASASDDVGVAGVQFKLDGNDLGSEDTSAPYSVTWDTTAATAGPHALTAVARDAAGNRTTSAAVPVTVDNSVPAGPVPVAAYNFEEASGGSVTDVTGKGHTGTIREAVRTTTGKNGRALRFDGVNDWVSIADANDLDLTTGMTLEAWVNPSNATGWRTALLKARTGDLSYALYSGGATNPNTSITTTGTSAYTEAVGPTAMTANTWTHLAATYDGSMLRLFRNGAQIATASRAGSITVGTGALYLGGNNVWAEWFAGQMDDVRVYDKALTAAQITTDMNTPVGGAPPPPPPADTSAPSVPGGVAATDGQGRVELRWDASTDNVGVTRYTVHRSATAGFTPSAANRVATVTGTSWTDTPLAVGTYRYRVVAEDAAGNASAGSAEVAGSSLPDSTAPTVSVSSPAAGATVSGSVSVGASASDDVGVAGVQFRLDGVDLGAEDTSAPYSVTWDATAASAGSHSLTAVARDAAGNRTTATAVPVTVDNSVPAGPVPVAAYNFEEASGSSVTDVTGKGHTGTIREAVRTTTGKNGRALRFDGVNDWVQIGDANDLDLTTGMTLEAWVNPSNVTGWRTAILKARPGDLSYALYSGGATNPNTSITTTGTSGYTEAVGPTAMTANTWTHLAATYDGSVLRLFRNGTQVATATRAGSITVGTGALYLGGNNVWAEWFAGQMDDVRVYDKALTAAQITTDMNTPVAAG